MKLLHFVKPSQMGTGQWDALLPQEACLPCSPTISPTAITHKKIAFLTLSPLQFWVWPFFLSFSPRSH